MIRDLAIFNLMLLLSKHIFSMTGPNLAPMNKFRLTLIQLPPKFKLSRSPSLIYNQIRQSFANKLVDRFTIPVFVFQFSFLSIFFSTSTPFAFVEICGPTKSQLSTWVILLAFNARFFHRNSNCKSKLKSIHSSLSILTHELLINF